MQKGCQRRIQGTPADSFVWTQTGSECRDTRTAKRSENNNAPPPEALAPGQGPAPSCCPTAARLQRAFQVRCVKLGKLQSCDNTTVNDKGLAAMSARLAWHPPNPNDMPNDVGSATLQRGTFYGFGCVQTCLGAPCRPGCRQPPAPQCPKAGAGPRQSAAASRHPANQHRSRDRVNEL